MKYRKKPVIIEAFQITHEIYLWFYWYRKKRRNIWNYAYFKFPKWLKESKKLFAEEFTMLEEPYRLFIKTLEGNHEISPEDWIIKGIKGELYPCEPDIFEQTYEKL